MFLDDNVVDPGKFEEEKKSITKSVHVSIITKKQCCYVGNNTLKFVHL